LLFLPFNSHYSGENPFFLPFSLNISF